jgi:tRNA-dihydrouridine synthase B
VFRELRAALRGEAVEVPDAAQQRAILVEHLQALYAFYGEAHGVRVARKHIGWYLRAHPALAEVRERVNAATDAATQLAAVSAL